MTSYVKVFDPIEFEIEHELFLARLLTFNTGECKKVLINEFERKAVPVWAVAVHYIPKFERVSMTGGPITTNDQAYRVLYQTNVIIGMSHLTEEIEEFTRIAQSLAEHNPDPTKWKEVFEK